MRETNLTEYPDLYSADLIEKLIQHDLSTTTTNEYESDETTTSFDSTTTSDYVLLQNDDDDDDVSSNSTLTKKSSIAVNSNEEVKNTINPLSLQYCGILVSYFCVGILDGSFAGILYPLLVIEEGVSSSSYTACYNLVFIFWSYKIFFGILSDCIPIFGYKRKGYIITGWILCAFTLCGVTFMSSSDSNEIHWKHLVTMLSLANLGYVMSDVAADAAMVIIAHQESGGKRGNMQTLVNISYYAGCVIVNMMILFGFSGPESNCPGYERDKNKSCTTNEKVSNRNELSNDHPDAWCHMKCNAATFNFGLTTSEFIYVLTIISVSSLPFYFLLREDKSPTKNMVHFLQSFWETQIQKRSLWQIILYVMISQITFSISNAAKPSSNYVWLHLTTMQNQFMRILESFVFMVGLNVMRKFGYLDTSWRKLVFMGTIVVTFFNLLYYLVIFDIFRSSWFYIFTDVSVEFMAALNYVVASFCTVEVVEPGYEAITLALITTASNTVNSLSAVISFQLLAFFPKLNSQHSLAEDTTSVRTQFATLHLIVIIINVSSLLSLPMLPRQKKETHKLAEEGGTSFFWGTFTLISIIFFLTCSTVVTFVTVAGGDTYGCYKVLGGSGCTSHESSIPVYFLVGSTFVYCYGLMLYFVFLPLIKKSSSSDSNSGSCIRKLNDFFSSWLVRYDNRLEDEEYDSIFSDDVLL